MRRSRTARAASRLGDEQAPDRLVERAPAPRKVGVMTTSPTVPNGSTDCHRACATPDQAVPRRSVGCARRRLVATVQGSPDRGRRPRGRVSRDRSGGSSACCSRARTGMSSPGRRPCTGSTQAPCGRGRLVPERRHPRRGRDAVVGSTLATPRRSQRHRTRSGQSGDGAGRGRGQHPDTQGAPRPLPDGARARSVTTHGAASSASRRRVRPGTARRRADRATRSG